MTTLHIIDNPGGKRLDDDIHWLRRLAEQADPTDSLLLIGFTDDDLVTVRRRLAGAFIEADMLAVTQFVRARLDAADPELCHIAIQRAIAGLAPASIACHGHADQPAREWLPQPAITDKTKTDDGWLPRLAFVSPLPPEPTGIADYSAELLPFLAEHFDITLVASQPKVEDALLRRFPVIAPEAFSSCIGDFDRVLYQIGNSPYHAYQFDLLRRHPGVVVLHDVFLFDAVWWLQESGVWPDGLRRQLFNDHGFPAVVALEDGCSAQEGGQVRETFPIPDNSLARDKHSRGPEQYPVNGFVTHEAAGLIYHSVFAQELDRRAGCISRVRVIGSSPARIAPETYRPGAGSRQNRAGYRRGHPGDCQLWRHQPQETQ